MPQAHEDIQDPWAQQRPLSAKNAPTIEQPD